MSTQIAPYRKAVAVTPHDTTLMATTRGVYVGGAGNLVALMESGDVATFTGVPAGTTLPIAVQRINSTSTTATAILALY